MILPNLIPNDVPYDFRASLDAQTNILTVAFLDKSTGCQTHDIELKFLTRSSAYFFLTRNLRAILDEIPSKFLEKGYASGRVVGKEAFTTIMNVGSETLLDSEARTPWFTGSHQPFATRTFPMIVWLAKNKIASHPSTLSHAITKFLGEYEFYLPREIIDEVLEADYFCDSDEPFAASLIVKLSAKHSLLANIFASLVAIAEPLLDEQPAES